MGRRVNIRLRNLMLCFSVGQSIIPARAQSAAEQFRPELGIYIQQGPALRIEVIGSGNMDQSMDNWQRAFALYVQTALKPVLRRELRDRPDVYRQKYLTVRGGYRQQTSFTNGRSSSGKIGILELTSRYLLPWQFVISDRNRGDFRFFKGQPFSTRYRNRLRLERDIKYRWLNCTPYVYDEVYYDTRYDQWTRNRYAFGVELPVGPHVVLEPYYLRQTDSHSNPRRVNALGFKLNLYF